MLGLTNKKALISYHRPHSSAAESYRGLRTNLRYSKNDPKTILITSAQSSEGKTTVASNLAVICAEEGKKVLLVDAQLRSPKIHEIFSLSNRIGLTNLLAGQYTLQETTVQSRIDNISIVPSGPQTNHPYELFGRERMDWVFEEMSKCFDIVLIDAPSVLQATDALLLAAKCEGVLLVIQTNKSNAPQVLTVKNKIEQVGATLLGVVLNKRF